MSFNTLLPKFAYYNFLAFYFYLESRLTFKSYLCLDNSTTFSWFNFSYLPIYNNFA